MPQESSDRPASQSSLSSRRPKEHLSCSRCRQKKLRCDRERPCRTCLKHGARGQCVYPRVVDIPNRPQNEELSSPRLLERIRILEQMVVSLQRRTEAAEQPEDISAAMTGSGSVDDLPKAFGCLHLQSNEPRYVGNAHWGAILDNIKALKDHVADAQTGHGTDREPQSTPASTGPALLYRSETYSKVELISYLPTKAVADALVQYYFSMAIRHPIIHKASFFKEYNRFWEQPMSATVTWIGLLFALLCLSLQYQHSCPDSSTPDILKHSATEHNQIQLYREKVVDCLQAGGYTNPGPYTVETLFLYFCIEHIYLKEPSISNWLVLGLVVRIGMRLGLHRDPSHSPQISPFQGEMRRRLWYAISQLDFMTSCQVGLPGMIRKAFCDCVEPRNLDDDELDESLPKIPEGHPLSVRTPMAFQIILNRLLAVLAKIFDAVESAQGLSLLTKNQLDQELQQLQAGFPRWVQMKSFAELTLDAPEMAMHRIQLDTFYQYARCVLHRDSVPSRPSHTEEKVRSHTSCIEAATKIISYQSFLGQEMRLGGRLQSVRWLGTSLVNHIYLFASTIICADMYNDLCAEPRHNSISAAKAEDRAKLLRALEASCERWLQADKQSYDVRKAAEAMRLVLRKASQDMEGGSASVQYQEPEQLDSSSISELLSISPYRGVSAPGAHLGDTGAINLLGIGSTFQAAEENMHNPILDMSGVDWFNLNHGL